MTNPTRSLLPQERELLRGLEPDVLPAEAQTEAARYVGDALVRGETWTNVRANRLTVAGLTLQNTIWRDIRAMGGAWSRLVVREGVWRAGHFTSTRFIGCTFAEARLEGCTFEGCSFEDCLFESSRWLGCTFIDCLFRRCKLVSVRAELELRGCTVEDTEMLGTSLVGRIDRLEWMNGRASLLSLTRLEANTLTLCGVKLEHLDFLGGRYQDLVMRRCSGSNVSLADVQVGALVVEGCDSLVMLRVLGGHVSTLRLEDSVLAVMTLAEVEIDVLGSTRTELQDANLQAVRVAGASLLDGRIAGIVIEGGCLTGLALARTVISGYLEIRGAEFQGLDLRLALPPTEGLDIELVDPVYVGPGDRWEVWSGT